MARTLLVVWMLLTAAALPAAEPAGGEADIDAGTLRHKVLCGYQGWFRCPGDGTDEGWRHWSRDAGQLTPDTATFEMWPDLTDFTTEEKFPAAEFTLAEDRPAHLFSSAHPRTVRRHFEWMRDHEIDGVFLQRFLIHADEPSTDLVLKHVRDSAAATGRIYAICYDLTGARPESMPDRLLADWRRLVDELKITRDSHYLRHEGRPVLMVWGFFSDRFRPSLAGRLIDALKSDAERGATLIGGCQWQWRGEEDPAWAETFRRFDVISPWNVGNFVEVEGRRYAATEHWRDDLAEARRCGMEYLPVLYPGFGWTNLKGRNAAAAAIPRLGGEFYWRQFAAAADLGVEMAYVAMFDEVDEGTAIFKVTNSPPREASFQTYEGLPPDWYLRLTGEGAKVIRGERKSQRRLPIEP